MCARAHTYTFSFLMMNLYSDSIQIDSSVSLGKNRVRSMVNQLNAAVSSTTSPAIPSTISAKRTPTTPSSTVNPRRVVSIEPTSTNKTTITSSSRPSLQRAMTINNQSPVTPSTINNNNISSTYKRKYLNIDLLDKRKCKYFYF